MKITITNNYFPLKRWILLSLIIPLFQACSKQSYFYVGSRTDKPIDRISLFTLDVGSGKLEKVKSFSGVKSAKYLTLSSDQKVLYALDTEKVDGDKKYESVASFKRDLKTGNLTLINKQSTEGTAACYLSTTLDDKFLLVANYWSGNLVVLPINKDGSLNPVVSNIQHVGSGPNKERQEMAHAHYIHTTNNGKYVLAADLGTDKVMNYTLSKEGKLAANPHQAFIKMPPGGGPRHLAFHPNGKFVYILNELTSTMSACTIDAETGIIKIIETHPMLPADFKEFNKSAAVRIHPNGKYLYASNRGHDSITAFEVLANGNINRIQIMSIGIDWVRDFNIDSGGKFMIVGNLKLNQLRTLRIKNGRLEKTEYTIEVESPYNVTMIN